MTDVAKLVKKLRNTTLYCEDEWESGLPLEAADAITALSAENERLRAIIKAGDYRKGEA